jgi:hypothetical protein
MRDLPVKTMSSYVPRILIPNDKYTKFIINMQWLLLPQVTSSTSYPSSTIHTNILILNPLLNIKTNSSGSIPGPTDTIIQSFTRSSAQFLFKT